MRLLSVLFLLLALLVALPHLMPGPEPARPAADQPTEKPADVVPKDLKPLGGRWYLRASEPPAYLYRDGQRYVELFVNRADSNRDGTPDVRVEHDDRHLIVRTQNLPDHPTATFPNTKNPNSIRPQRFEFHLPLVPRKADRVTRAPMGPIGLAVNGVVFFNPFEAGGLNAVEGYAEVWLDSCCGHPQPEGVYHYHKYPTCVKTPFVDDGSQHSPPIGFAWDGYPVYGPYEDKGVLAKDLKGTRALDACNGHNDEDRGYHYHVTPGRFPYIIGGYAGVPEPVNSRPLRHAGVGPLEDNTRGAARPGPLASVKPGSGARGKTISVRIELIEKGPPIPPGPPTRILIGPFEATRSEREGRVVTADVAIPTDANPGTSLDCHLEFAGPGGRVIVFKKNDAFRITE